MSSLCLRNIYAAPTKNVPSRKQLSTLHLGVTPEAVRIYTIITAGTCQDVSQHILIQLVDMLVDDDHAEAARLCLIATGDRLYVEPYIYRYDEEAMEYLLGQNIMCDCYQSVWEDAGDLVQKYFAHMRGSPVANYNITSWNLEVVRSHLAKMTHPLVRAKTIEFISRAVEI